MESGKLGEVGFLLASCRNHPRCYAIRRPGLLRTHCEKEGRPTAQSDSISKCRPFVSCSNGWNPLPTDSHISVPHFFRPFLYPSFVPLLGIFPSEPFVAWGPPRASCQRGILRDLQLAERDLAAPPILWRGRLLICYTFFHETNTFQGKSGNYTLTECQMSFQFNTSSALKHGIPLTHRPQHSPVSRQGAKAVDGKQPRVVTGCRPKAELPKGKQPNKVTSPANPSPPRKGRHLIGLFRV